MIWFTWLLMIPPFASAATGQKWIPAISKTLPLIIPLVNPTAAATVIQNLSRLDLTSSYGQKVIAPLSEHLKTQKITLKAFTQMPESQKAQILTQAVQEHSRNVNQQAQQIVDEYFAKEPEKIMENAQSAENLLLFSHPFLEEPLKNDLAKTHEHLKSQADQYKLKLARKIVGRAFRLWHNPFELEEDSVATDEIVETHPPESASLYLQLTLANKNQRTFAKLAAVYINEDTSISELERTTRLNQWLKIAQLMAKAISYCSTPGSNSKLHIEMQLDAVVKLLKPLMDQLDTYVDQDDQDHDQKIDPDT
ncbi:MAG: hypothetical protein HY400_04110, partial [Elusimicrobia bacterium]|nr:hypothetical protein [Elusimicrobiota bacterium]